MSPIEHGRQRRPDPRDSRDDPSVSDAAVIAPKPTRSTHTFASRAHAPSEATRKAAGPSSEKRSELQRPSQLLLLVLLSGLLIYLPNQVLLRIDTGLRGLNVANVMFLVTLGLVLLLKVEPERRATPLKVPLMFFFAALTWGLLIALSGDSSAWVEDVTVYKNAVFYPLLFFLYFHAVQDLKTVRVLVLLTLLLMLSSGILGLRQAIDYGLGTFNEYKRVSAPFGWSLTESNRAAVFFCIHLQLVLIVALFMRSRPWLRLLCCAIFVLGVFVVFHTYSRQAYGIVAATTLLIAMRRNLLLAALAGIALFNYALWVPDTVVQRIEMTKVDPLDQARRSPQQVATFDPVAALDRPWYESIERYQALAAAKSAPAGGDDGPKFDESTESRITLWTGAWELIQQKPLGIGLNRFKREIGPYVPEALYGYDAHNYYVLLTTEAGVLAPVTMAVLLGALLLLGYRLSSLGDGDETKVLGLGFMMATLAVVAGNVYGSRFVDGDVMGNYWILAGLVARTLHIKEQERRERTAFAGAGERLRRSVRTVTVKPMSTPNAR